MYKLLKDNLGNIYGVQKQLNSFTYGIPFDPANTDYQEYLKWLAEGNQPLPAETQE